jgi:hypothetical protein
MGKFFFFKSGNLLGYYKYLDYNKGKKYQHYLYRAVYNLTNFQKLIIMLTFINVLHSSLILVN